MYGRTFSASGKDFEETKHYGGTSPAWPFGYETLKPLLRIWPRKCTMFMETWRRPTEPPTELPTRYHPGFEPLISDLETKTETVRPESFSPTDGRESPAGYQ